MDSSPTLFQNGFIFRFWKSASIFDFQKLSEFKKDNSNFELRQLSEFSFLQSLFFSHFSNSFWNTRNVCCLRHAVQKRTRCSTAAYAQTLCPRLSNHNLACCSPFKVLRFLRHLSRNLWSLIHSLIEHRSINGTRLPLFARLALNRWNVETAHPISWSRKN